VTVRPPANEPLSQSGSETLFVEFMKRVASTAQLKIVLLPRNKCQEAQIPTMAEWFKDAK